jgi:hypothetical protein
LRRAGRCVHAAQQRTRSSSAGAPSAARSCAFLKTSTSSRVPGCIACKMQARGCAGALARAAPQSSVACLAVPCAVCRAAPALDVRRFSEAGAPTWGGVAWRQVQRAAGTTWARAAQVESDRGAVRQHDVRLPHDHPRQRGPLQVPPLPDGAGRPPPAMPRLPPSTPPCPAPPAPPSCRRYLSACLGGAAAGVADEAGAGFAGDGGGAQVQGAIRGGDAPQGPQKPPRGAAAA